MNLKPSSLFIVVINLFSVLLPGLIVTYFLKPFLCHWLFGMGKVFSGPENETEELFLFLVTAYIIGHLIFAIAFFLDKPIYDKLLRNTFFRKDYDQCLLTAHEIRNRCLDPNTIIAGLPLEEREKENLLKPGKHEVINAFNWSMQFIALKYPERLAEIKKPEAGAKLFRSLVISFVIIAIVLFSHGQFLLGFIALILSVLSLYCYGRLRYNSIQAACEIVIEEYLIQTETGQENIPAESTLVKSIGELPLATEMQLRNYFEKIGHIKRGNAQTFSTYALPANADYTFTNGISSACSFYLIDGNGKLILGNTDILLTPDALTGIPPKIKFKIKNILPDDLLLLIAVA